MESSFAIVVDQVLVMCMQESDGLQVEIYKGMMVEIKNVSDRISTIMIHDHYQKNLEYENVLYLCKSSALFPVPFEIWPYLIAVNDPLERLGIAKDKAFTEYILSLRINSYATVNGQLFSNTSINQSLMFLPEREPREKSLNYECIVRYVGSIDEVGPGFVFGLELLVNF